MGCGASKEAGYTAGSAQVQQSGTKRKPSLLDLSSAEVGAVGLIQRWYRQKNAELQLRRKCCWQVFTDIEYKDEQEQLELGNFFNDLEILKEALAREKQQRHSKSENGDVASEKAALKVTTMYQSAESEHEISGDTEDKLFDRPNQPSNLTVKILKDLIKGCQEGHVVNSKLALSILDEAFVKQKVFPNIRSADTRTTHKITVVGDLHGKLIDLLMIFEKNGLPSDQNPYVFNGDFVDRGKHGMEITIILLGFQLLFPDSVYITRGNHEDYLMNKRYGFEQEVVTKYKAKASTLLRALAAVFSALPLGVIINHKVLVIHGGLSGNTDLAVLSKAKRQTYVSILRAAKHGPGANQTADETEQVVNVVWSDPGRADGSLFNTVRGGGCVWGPDVTKAFLEKYDLELLVRSHECMPMGYGWSHFRKVLTVFSASDYYATGSNFGAYVRFDSETKPHIVQFEASKRLQHGKPMCLRDQVGIVEKAAVKSILEKIFECKPALLRAFAKIDPYDTGYCKISEWVETMEQCTGLRVPWFTMRKRFVTPATAAPRALLDAAEAELASSTEPGDIATASRGVAKAKAALDAAPKDKVDYRTCLESVHLDHSMSAPGSEDDEVAQTLYQHLGALEFIFRLIDTDASGSISKDEFILACQTLNRFIGRDEVDDLDASSMADAMDLDGDGRIDFNEFTESFRLVRDKGGDSKSEVSFIAMPGDYGPDEDI